jgi:hypothetical protein
MRTESYGSNRDTINMEALMLRYKRKIISWLTCLMLTALAGWISNGHAQSSGKQSESGPSALPSPTKNLKAPYQKKSGPDLYVSEFSLNPSPPSSAGIVEVRIGVYNQGSSDAGPFTVEWYPGIKYRAPGCTWRVEGLVARGGRILKCSGYVFPSWYEKITTGAKVDSRGEVNEQDEGNNFWKEEIQVLK